MTRAELVEAMAINALHRQGFGYYTDPMEGGQNAYDLSCEAREEAEAHLAAIEAAGMAVVPSEAVRHLIWLPAGGPQDAVSASAWVYAAVQARAMIAASPVEARDEAGS